MNFLMRQIQEKDLDSSLRLAQQFSLLNFPPDRKVIETKISESLASFAGELDRDRAKYVFVLENIENGEVVGTSQVKATHGTPEEPAYSFKIIKKERFSQELGVGFIHQILQLKINEAGPSEIGGLLVSENYRGRPEKIGKIVSLGRFLYMGMAPDRFQERVYAQMAPPLTDDGRSEFWEALGRRFTGMPYKEADSLSQRNKEFIRSLFPEEDIYLCLLDAKARLVIGRVGQETQAALHMLESIGFEYFHEIDPFDGGPHVGCALKEVSLIKNAKYFDVSSKSSGKFGPPGFVSVLRNNEFLCGGSPYYFDGDEIILPDKTKRALQLSSGEKVYFSPVN